MTSEQIAMLRETLRAANTPVWGVTDGKTVTWTTTPDVSEKITLALRRWLPRLLDEREALLGAAKDLRGLAYNALRIIGDSREKVESHVSIVRADLAIAKAESP